MHPFPILFGLFAIFSGTAGLSADLDTQRQGWSIHQTSKSFDDLAKDTRVAIKANGLIVVTQAGPTKAAAKRGLTIPGNLVIGAFNNDFAVKVLATSIAAMIEAPIRFYVTENSNGSATLSYKTPSFVFSPYLEEGGEDLANLAAELDMVFEKIATAAAQ